MLQLTSFTQKISLLLVLSLLSTLVPGPMAISGTRQAAPTGPAAFTSPLPTPTPQPQVATFASPLPTPAVPVPEPIPTLGLAVRAEPVGVAPGEVVTLP